MMQVSRLILPFLALVATIATAQGQTERSQPSKNLINNSSLEDKLAARGLPSGWSYWSAEDGSKYRSEVVDGGRTGKKCLKIEGEGLRGVVFANGVMIERDKRYALRGWARVQGDTNARAIIKFNYFHNGKWLGLPDDVGVTSKDEDWRLLAKTDRADEVPDASLIMISCQLEGNGTARFDDLELVAYDRNNLPENFDTRFGPSNLPAESPVLERFLGTWDTQTTTKPGVWVPAGLKTKGVETMEWVLGKKFIQGKSKVQPGNTEVMVILTYDTQFDVFRHWHFDSAGNFPRSEMTGQWDERTETLTFKSTDPNEVTVTMPVRFVTPDRIEWQAVWRAQNGRILMEMEAAATRRK